MYILEVISCVGARRTVQRQAWMSLLVGWCCGDASRVPQLGSCSPPTPGKPHLMSYGHPCWFNKMWVVSCSGPMLSAVGGGSGQFRRQIPGLDPVMPTRSTGVGRTTSGKSTHGPSAGCIATRAWATGLPPPPPHPFPQYWAWGSSSSRKC